MASNITITREDYEASKNFLIQFLRDSGYEGTLDDGTALHDLVVKAFALLYSLFKRESQKVSSYLSLEHAVTNKDLLGDDYDAAVDAILSNWFVSRKEGTKSTGYVRLWFSKALEFYRLVPTAVLANIDTVRFEPAVEQVFSAEDFTGVVNVSTGISEYYIDVQVRSTLNSDVLPTHLSSMTVYAGNIYFLRGEIVADFTPGIVKESSEDFIDRTKKVITTRELITDRAINTVVTDEIPEVQRLYVAGFGDPEQQRDVKTFSGVTVHVGNKADIYVVSNLSMASAVFTADAFSRVTISGPLPVGLISKVERLVDEDVWEEAAYTVFSCDDSLFGSLQQSMVLSIPTSLYNDQIRITFVTNHDVQTVVSLLTNPKNKVVCYDPLVKMMYVVKLAFNLSITRKSDYEEEDVVKGIKTYTAKYLSEINKQNTLYKESEYIAYIHENVPGLDRVSVPLNITYTVFDSKAKTKVTGELPEFIEAPEFFITTPQFTNNTMQFYTNSDFITVTVN